MQFYSPYFLNLLWLVPILIVCFFASAFLNANRLKSFLKTREIQDKLLPHYNRLEWPIRGAFLLAAFLLIVLALSQPQWGEEKKKVERKGVDLIFLLDVSLSMLAEDVKPSRVLKAKFEIEAFVKALKGHRIGMLTFAGSSFMQTPLTLDYSAFLIFLSGVDVGHVPDPGTSLGAAIEKAIAAFTDEKGKQKALVVFSDGEDHAAQIDSAVALAKQQNVRIYTIGTATGEGAPIPLKNERGVQTAVKKDRVGNIVITKLDKAVLSKIATETGGLYFPATPSEKEVDLILKHLSSLGEKKLEDRVVTEKEDHYQIFLFIALILLMLEMVVKRGRAIRLNILPFFFLVFILNSGFLPTAQNKVEEGNKDFEGKRYQSAIDKYREVQVKNPDDPSVSYNLATSLYKVDQYQESAAHLKKSMEKSQAENNALRAKIAYNYGNSLFRLGDYDGAVEAYKKALELNPQDQDSKYNLEYIQDQKSKFEKENQDRKKDNQDKKNDQNKQQNNKNQQQNQQQNQQNQGGGGSSKDNQNQQGQNNQQNQSGSGQQDQKQNQGGQGENKQNTGQNQGQDQKDQGQGQNQKDQQSQGDQSDQNKEQNQSSGGQGEKKDDEQNQGGQGQDQKDQGGGQQGQDQNQGGQGQQDQKEQQGQGQQDKQQGQGGQSQQEKEQNQQGGKGQEKNDQGQKPESKPGEQPGGGQKPQDQPSGGGASGGQAGGGAGEEQQQQAGGAGGKPLQGQMSKENAEYLLASLEEGEKKFQVMRKPAENQSEDPYVEKDW